MKPLHTYSAVIVLVAGLALASCDGGRPASSDPETMIAGSNSKAWRLKREPGVNEKATPVEKQENIVFDTMGVFYTKTPSETRVGSWEYTSETLTLQFDDNGEMRVYTVEQLSTDKMKLKAADDSRYVLTSE